MSAPPILRVDPRDRAQLDRIATHLEEGGLLGYPTETVYGFGAGVTPRGIRAVRRLKGRDDTKPFLVLVPDRSSEDVTRLDWTPSALALAEAVWPGALTLVLRDPGARYPEGVRSAGGGGRRPREQRPLRHGVHAALAAGPPLDEREPCRRPARGQRRGGPAVVRRRRRGPALDRGRWAAPRWRTEYDRGLHGPRAAAPPGGCAPAVPASGGGA